MAVQISYYPPSPRNVPEDLAAPTPVYKRQVVAVFCCLMIFMLVYAALMILTFWLLIKAFKVFFLLAVPVLFLFLFLVKALFHRHQDDEEIRIEVKAEEHPALFQFIDRVCEEVGAPLPYRVFLVPDVNACVSYEAGLLSLVLPPRKNLTIGLGLVNVLTMDEFKGVLAHEFGHFSQRSTRLGTYVYLANRIISTMVYGRDFWDRWVDRMRETPNVAIMMIGQGFYWVAWVLRKGLEGMFNLINSVNSALSRQMEFNADLVAVGLAGSDSIIHGLVRTRFAYDAFNQTVADLRSAAQHHHYTWDFFHHHTAAHAYLRQVRRKPHDGIPPTLPDNPEETTTLFDPDDEGLPPMWASHPPLYERERNAKRTYIRSFIDERSPWLLFRNLDKLRTEITKRINKEYLNYKKKFPLADPTIVQEFIDAEHAETTYDPKYQGMYDDRYVDPGKLGELVQVAVHASPQPKEIYAALVAVYPATLVKKMDKYFRHRAEVDLLVGLRSGNLVVKGGTFTLRKKKYRLAEIPKLLQRVEKDLETDHAFLKTIDRDVFLVHYRMARQLDPARAQTLAERYRFHLAVQEIVRLWNREETHVEVVWEFLSDKERLDPQSFEEVSAILRTASDTIREGLRQAADLILPALSNMDEGKRLDLFLVEGKLVKHFDSRNTAASISNKWIIDFIRQLHTLLERLKRVHFKSLGVILTLQEQIAKDWCRARNLALPQVQNLETEEPKEVLEVVEIIETGPVAR